QPRTTLPNLTQLNAVSGFTPPCKKEYTMTTPTMLPINE
ncbi:unnamed protein product, partial [marine sediment metagenome]